MRILMLNPKSVRMFLQDRQEWLDAGAPAPLVMVTARVGGDSVRLTNPLNGTDLGGGSLSGRGNDRSYYDVNTSEGVHPEGVGYGLMLYSGLALLARERGALGISSPEGGNAVDLWDAMVASKLADGEAGSGDEEDSEDVDVEIPVSLPTSKYDRRTIISYSDLLQLVRENASEMPEDVDDDDLTIEKADGSDSVTVTITVRWPIKPAGYTLAADRVLRAGFVLGGVSSAAEAMRRPDIVGKVPADLVAAIPIKTTRELTHVAALLTTLGQKGALERLLKREDIEALMPREGAQFMIPGVPAHYPRPPAEKWTQPNLPGVNGLRGLGAVPRGVSLSAAAQGILHRFGSIG